MRPPPRILALEPILGVSCAAGHPVDVLPHLYRRLAFFVRCGQHYGPRLGVCDHCLYLRPSGSHLMLVTDCTTQQMRAWDGKGLHAWEVAERVAADWHESRRSLRKQG